MVYESDTMNADFSPHNLTGLWEPLFAVTRPLTWVKLQKEGSIERSRTRNLQKQKSLDRGELLPEQKYANVFSPILFMALK